jgi:rhodanese-related sulfurtransferase
MAIEFVEPAAFSGFRESYPGVLMIDVRDAEMHAQLRLADSLNLPLDDLQARDFSAGLAAAIDAQAQVAEDHPVMLVCQLGRRATMAAQFLESRVNNPLFVLSGGINACQEAGLELCGGNS